MGEDKRWVQINGLLVVFGCLGEFGQDEVKLGAVVEDIGILVVLVHGLLEVVGGGILVAFGIVSLF